MIAKILQSTDEGPRAARPTPEVLPFDQLITFRSFPTRNSKYLSVEKREQRGRIDKMLGSIPGNLDVTETMVQAAQLQLQSL